MIESDVIIVGGGPAGSSCAWALQDAGMSVIVLDKQKFPRPKLCAGWITPAVLKRLRINPHYYPHNLTLYRNLHLYVRGTYITLPNAQYAIRRVEFDAWLLKRARVPVYSHHVKSVVEEDGDYIVDDRFRGRFLVGAGGTACPVYRAFFREQLPRSQDAQITTLELEVPYPVSETRCYLWFFENDLPGYSWYVPKNDYLNLGIGAKASVLKERGETIQEHWHLFIQKLETLGLIDQREWFPRGYTYYLRTPSVRDSLTGNVFVIGDAAGLATMDMGEGIGPAVESGIRAARAILKNRPLSFRGIHRYSARDILVP